jgi:hypothetical protein
MTDNRRMARRADDVEIKTLTHVIGEFMDETRRTAEDARKSRDSLHGKLDSVEEKVDAVEKTFSGYRPLMDTIKSEREDAEGDRRHVRRAVMGYAAIAVVGVVCAALLFYFAHKVSAVPSHAKTLKTEWKF